MTLAERMSRIGVESAFDVLVRARALEAQGRSVIHLEIGEPDFPTPPHVVAAAKKALDEGWTHYGPTQGQPELREAIAAHISRTRAHLNAARAGTVGGDGLAQDGLALRGSIVSPTVVERLLGGFDHMGRSR